MKEILEQYKSGLIGLEEAQSVIMRLMYEKGSDFMLDMHRAERTGFPEIIFAEGKTDGQITDIVRRMLSASPDQPVIVSNLTDDRFDAVETGLEGYPLKRAGRILAAGSFPEPGKLGTVGIITAGTADIPYARECELVLLAIGAGVITSFDAGVAGIHRPFLSIRDVKDASVILVIAGMEGALTSIVVSLTDKPLIALPTPVGYGIGGGGIGALTTMLQTCSPGVTVVNIGNTIGASAAAARILRAIKKSG
jgi:NCAIR mutase (PurE)-related protein